MDLERAADQLDRLIEKRARERKTADAVEDLWEKTVKRDEERRRRRLRAEWYAYFSRLAEAHARISERFAGQAERLLEDESGNGRSNA